MRPLSLIVGALMRAGAVLIPNASESSRRIVVVDAVVRATRRAEGRTAPKFMDAGDYIAMETAQAKRDRKALRRRLYG
jgi:hypothetical protein